MFKKRKTNRNSGENRSSDSTIDSNAELSSYGYFTREHFENRDTFNNENMFDNSYENNYDYYNNNDITIPNATQQYYHYGDRGYGQSGFPTATDYKLSHTTSLFLAMTIGITVLLTIVSLSFSVRHNLNNSAVTFPTLPSSNSLYQLPSILYKTDSNQNYLIDPNLADQVTTTLWSLQEKAFQQHDQLAIDQLVSSFTPAYYVNGPLSECSKCPLEWPPKIFDVTTIMPVLQNYPLYFAAQFKTQLFDGNFENKSGNQYASWIMVIGKIDATHPWTIDFNTYNDSKDKMGVYPFSQNSTFNSANSSYAGNRTFAVNVENKYMNTTSNTLLAKLANYWQIFKATGQPPKDTNFSTASDNYYFGKYIAHYGLSGQISIDSENNTRYRTYYKYNDMNLTDNVPSYFFVLQKNVYLSCGAILVSAQMTPVGSKYLIQTSSKYFASDVSPGRYTMISVNSTHSSCVLSNANRLTSYGNINGSVESTTTG